MFLREALYLDFLSAQTRGAAALSTSAIIAAVSTPDTAVDSAGESAPAKPSNDLMVEVDGKLVPNYDATLISFDEGDVVSGKVVRIDKDEVLVDIGYKSEGVIP